MSPSLHLIPSQRSPKTSDTLQRCSLRDGALHGAYMGIADAVYLALLTLSHAPAVLFSVLVHGSSTVLIIAQWLGATGGRCIRNQTRALAIYSFIQAALLMLLFTLLALRPIFDIWLGISVCSIALLSTGVGNMAAPLWHLVWSSSLKLAPRLSLLTRRGEYMTAASFVAALLGQGIFHEFPARGAILFLLASVSAGKLFSAFTLLRLELTSNATHAACAAIKKPSWVVNSKIRPQLLTLTPANFGVGLTAAFLIPFLINTQFFSASAVFTMVTLELLGQLLIMKLLRRYNLVQNKQLLLVGSAFPLAVIPLLWCVAAGPAWWGAIFLFSGITTGMRALGIQALVQDQLSPTDVADSQAFATMLSTFVSVAGGLIGLALVTVSPFPFAATCSALFIASAGLRISSGYLLHGSLRKQEQAAFFTQQLSTESEIKIAA